MKTKTFGFAVIGCGAIATEQHLPALSNNPHVRLLATCDAEIERARRAAECFGVERHYDDVRRVLDDPAIDAVVVATPPWVTPQLVIEALRSGKDVLAEKPMALSIEETQRVIEVEKATGHLVQVGFTYRHGPLMDALRRWIVEGCLGSPLLVRLGVFDETWAPETDPEHYAKLTAVLEHGPPCIHDGAHSADHLHFLTASQATRVTAHGLKSRPEFPDTNYNCAIIEFKNGDVAKLEIGWFYPHFPRGEFEILGPKGIACFDREKRESVLQTGGTYERVQLDEDWVRSCFSVQSEKFVRCLEERRTPIPGTSEAIASLRLTKAFEQAMKSGVPVMLDEAYATDSGDAKADTSTVNI
jgi:predicted dehydrogenase